MIGFNRGDVTTCKISEPDPNYQPEGYETEGIKDLVCSTVIEDNPYLLDMIKWHREHRSEWDDISPKKKKSKGKKNGRKCD